MELFKPEDELLNDKEETPKFKNPYRIFIDEAKEIEANYIDADLEIERNKKLTADQKKIMIDDFIQELKIK
jgi:hypothetical protein